MHATVQFRLTPNDDDHLSSYICTLLALYPGMGPGYVMFSISVWCHQCADVYIKAEALEFYHMCKWIKPYPFSSSSLELGKC